MIRTLRGVFIALILVAGLVAWVPEETKGIFLITGVWDCCQGSGPEAWCEPDGCWFVKDCSSDEDCRAN
jgi:hypothetical protein